MELPVPDASPPTVQSDVIMSLANCGPFVSNQKKSPVNIIKRQSSAKNSPTSARLIAMEMHVHENEIVAKIQKMDVPALLSVPTQPRPAFLYFARRLSTTPVTPAA